MDNYHSNLTKHLKYLQDKIKEVTLQSSRQPEDVRILAASKGQSIATLQKAYALGLSEFGESRLQEALVKIVALKSYPICWHFIGPIQSNKTKKIAQYFSWVHSLSRLEIARRLNHYRPKELGSLQVCVEINLDNESNKAGVKPENALRLINSIQSLPQLQLRGLMAIPRPNLNKEEQYQSFLRLRNLLFSLNTELNLTMDTLSMGMSADFPAAIAAGSTIIRIGRNLFKDSQ